ncbi:hypothetical protein Agub_g7651, partial [Astrephomene gubernaculifera]
MLSSTIVNDGAAIPTPLGLPSPPSLPLSGTRTLLFHVRPERRRLVNTVGCCRTAAFGSSRCLNVPHQHNHHQRCDNNIEGSQQEGWRLQPSGEHSSSWGGNALEHAAASALAAPQLPSAATGPRRATGAPAVLVGSLSSTASGHQTSRSNSLGSSSGGRGRGCSTGACGGGVQRAATAQQRPLPHAVAVRTSIKAPSQVGAAAQGASRVPTPAPGEAALTAAIVACDSWEALASLLAPRRDSLNPTHVTAALVVLARLRGSGGAEGSHGGGLPGGGRRREADASPAAATTATRATRPQVYGSLSGLANDLCAVAVVRQLPYMSAREVSNFTWALARLAPVIVRRPAEAVAATASDVAATERMAVTAAEAEVTVTLPVAVAALQAACHQHWSQFTTRELVMLLYGMVRLDPTILPYDLSSAPTPTPTTISPSPPPTHPPSSSAHSPSTSTPSSSSWLAAWFTASEPHLPSLGPRGLHLTLWALAQVWTPPRHTVRARDLRNLRNHQTLSHSHDSRPAPCVVRLPPPPASWVVRLRVRLAAQLPHLHAGPLVRVAWGLARLQPWLMPGTVRTPAAAAGAEEAAAAGGG